VLAVGRRAAAARTGAGTFAGAPLLEVLLGAPAGANVLALAGCAVRHRDHLAGVVEQHRRRGRPPNLLDAHHALLAHARGGTGDGDDVAVDFRDRVVDVVHVW